MRTLARRTFLAALAFATTPAWSGCTPKKQTEYVAGVSTQVRVPRDLRAVRISVLNGGVQVICRGYRVYNGVVQLPRSLGAYALNDPDLAGPITYSIVGYSEDIAPGDDLDDLACGRAVAGTDGARILRRSTQPYVPEKVLFLPMPLKFSCFDRDCPDEGTTCKGGRCVPDAVDPSTLPEYTPDLLDGTGGACFSLRCLSPAPNIPPPAAVLVNADDCTYAVANSPDEPAPLPGAPDLTPGESTGEGVNVLVAYDGGLNVEVLDKDLDREADYANGVGEGFVVPDPAKPQQFRLAPGLCDMVKGVDEDGVTPLPHRITSVRASGACRAKTKFQPICASDQLDLMAGAFLDVAPGGLPVGGDAPTGCVSREIKPPNSELVVVVDNTEGHEGFFGQAETQTLNLSLDDPAFERTSLGLVYSPGSLALACDAARAPDVPVGPSRTAKEQIAQSFAQYAPGTRAVEPVDGAPTFAGALARAYEAVGARDAFRRAVVVFGNRDFDPAADACALDSPAALAQAAKAGPLGVDTYVLLLVKTPDGVDQVEVLAGANRLAAAGGTLEATDAREEADRGKAVDLFQTLVESLATCVYDVPDTAADPAPPPDSTLGYLDPLSGQKVVVEAGTCGGEGAPGRGWGYGPGAPAGQKRIFLCQDSCADYRDVLSNASKFNLGYGQPAPAVPIFVHRSGCVPAP